jgi:hypothetical protein
VTPKRLAALDVTGLLKVSAWGALAVPTFKVPKFRLDGDNVGGDDAAPVHVTGMLPGLFEAFDVTTPVSGRGPTAVGWHATVIVQVPPGATGARQVVECG